MRKKLMQTLVAVVGVAALSGITAGTAQAAEARTTEKVVAPNMDTCIAWGYSLDKTDPTVKAWHCYLNAKDQAILELIR